MTSSAIQDITGISYAGGSKVQSKKSGFDSADESVGSFQNAMNLAKGNAKAEQQPVTVSKSNSYEYQSDSSTDSKAVTKQEKPVKTVKEDAKAEETAKTDDPAVKEAVEKKTEDLEKEVVKEIADTLDVSEEDVEEAMQILGLTFMDLSDQANMAALVTELTADGDSMAMLTDENLFADIVDLTEQVAELIETGAEELSSDLSVDFSEVMDMMTEAAAEEESVLPNEVVSKPEVVPEEVLGKIAKESDVRYEIENPEEEITNPADVPAEAEAAVKDSSEAAQTFEDKDDSSAKDSDHGAMSHTDAQPMFPVNDVNNTAPAPEVAAVPESYTQVDAQDIIEQIVRHVRVNNGSDFSEVEMALHPASLGNIHLQVTARDGVITAQIAAENEAVKDALLVQAMVLKEELSGQGLKIEAVEVTVASHEFEQNMQGENGENAEQMYEEQVKKETRRRIVLSGLEEAEEMLADENLTDAERIRIDMMAKSGSSMDMLA